MDDSTVGAGSRLTVANVDRHLIERLYSRFASVYDAMFGSVLDAGRREAMRELEVQPGDEILEIGVGTGLTAALYPADCRVTGIDLSESMLRRAARQLVAQERRNIHLRRMDASRLAFPDQSFDVVYAAYVISVVPDPVAVLREMRRVCRVGGRIVLLNHFRSTSPILATFERLISPLTARAGFRADLDLSLLMARSGLEPVSVRKVNTPGIWSLVRCFR